MNVFVGLGLPWIISSIYQEKRGEKYVTPAGDLAFSVVLFLITSVACFMVLGVRRYVSSIKPFSGIIRTFIIIMITYFSFTLIHSNFLNLLFLILSIGARRRIGRTKRNKVLLSILLCFPLDHLHDSLDPEGVQHYQWFLRLMTTIKTTTQKIDFCLFAVDIINICMFAVKD